MLHEAKQKQITQIEAARRLKISDRRSLGPRFWYGAGPWAATRLVAAIKPDKA